MRNAFRHHHKLSDADKQQLWRTCIFVLDTNVLLNIYRYSDGTRGDLFRVLEHLGDRIWVPYYAAKEFYGNRIEVITEQSSKFNSLEAAVSSVLKLEDTFKKSGFLKLSELRDILKPAVDKAVTLISNEKKKHPNLLDDDPYLEELVRLVGSSIGVEPAPDEFEKEGKLAQSRIDGIQPPGYKDAQKPIPNRYGDVFIWFEILRLAEDRKLPIMFVTDDEKEDWWQIVAGKKLGPRPELRGEIRKKADVEFQICSPAQLMERVGRELKTSVPTTSINDAKQIAEQSRRREAERAALLDLISGHGSADSAALQIRAESAVERWLSLKHPGAKILRIPVLDVSFILQTEEKTTPVQVISFDSVNVVHHLADKCLALVPPKSLPQMVVLVGARERVAEQVRPTLSTLLPANTGIVLGYLEDGTGFYQLAEL